VVSHDDAFLERLGVDVRLEVGVDKRISRR